MTQIGIPVRFRRHAALVPPRPDDVLLDASIGPDGATVALWVRPADRDAVTGYHRADNGVGFPAACAERPVAALAAIGDETVQVPELRHAHPHVQPLPGGAVVVAGTRAAWHPDTGPERNATVVGPDGDVVAEQTIGDGIAHMLTSASGDVWVGYFDEGIYGGFGWGGPGTSPIGHPGLVRFDPALRRTWEYPFRPDTGAETGPIDECYGLNVDGGTAWCLMLGRAGFAVDEITGRGVHGRTGHGSASALCTDGIRMALASYDGGITVCAVEETDLRPMARHEMALPDGSVVDGSRHTLVGRGTTVYLLTADTCHRLDLDDIPAG